jgi:hypothetical protein
MDELACYRAASIYSPRKSKVTCVMLTQTHIMSTHGFYLYFSSVFKPDCVFFCYISAIAQYLVFIICLFFYMHARLGRQPCAHELLTLMKRVCSYSVRVKTCTSRAASLARSFFLFFKASWVFYILFIPKVIIAKKVCVSVCLCVCILCIQPFW